MRRVIAHVLQHCGDLPLDNSNARAYFPRPREQSGLRTNMSPVMNHGYEMRVDLSRGCLPIDGARLAHGNDLA
jgi:hypothetical protein